MGPTPWDDFFNILPSLCFNSISAFAPQFFPEEISKSVDQGIELLDAVHDQGESIIVFDGRKIPVRDGGYSHSDVVHHTLRLGDSKKHSLQN